MGFNRGNTASYKFANVADGALWCGDEEWNSFTGLVRGIRVKQDAKFGVDKLEILMMDHETMNPADQVVISGTLYNGNGTVTTWGRMLVSRLINPAHNLDPAEPIEIGVYAAGGDKRATCASLRRAGDPEALRGVEFHKEDPDRCRKLTEIAIGRLIEKYGAIGGPTHQQADDEDEWDGDVAPIERPAAGGMAIPPSTNQRAAAPAAPAAAASAPMNGNQLASELYGDPKPKRNVGPDDDDGLPF